MSLPIRNRAASADYADAIVNKRLDTLRLRNLQQQIRQEVLNAVSQVENSRASVDCEQRCLKDFAGIVLETRSIHLTSTYGCNARNFFSLIPRTIIKCSTRRNGPCSAR